MSWLKNIQEKMFDDLVMHNNQADYLRDAHRLHVYTNGYYARIASILGSDFELIQWILGKTEFDALVQDFIKQHPSTEYNINNLGGHFSDFLKQHPLIQSKPYLSDLAMYEWNLGHAQLLVRKNPADFAAYQSISLEQWTDARFEFQPNLLLMQTQWAFQELHAFYQQQKPFQPNMLRLAPTYFVFYQKQDGSYASAIDADEYKTLTLLMNQSSLGDVISALGNEEMVQSVFAWFQKWQEKEWITNIEFESHESE